jgi:hypothetical protein
MELHGVSLGSIHIIWLLIEIEAYNKEKAERLAQRELRATPMASTSREGAAWGEHLFS